MSVFRHRGSCALALALSIWVVACSDEESGPPEGQPPESTEAPAEASPTTPAGPAQQRTEFVLVQDDAHFLSSRLAQAYRERCLDSEGGSGECDILQALVVAETVTALEEIERARDQRGTRQALAALDLDQEPEILLAAMRILGQFPDTPGVSGKVWPLLLESPYLAVQQMAARVLASGPEPTPAALGSYWDSNHNTLYAEDAYQAYPDFAPHYATMGFPDYPDAEWFSPADSDRSVGWWTTDDFAAVSAWLAEELGSEGLDYRAWSQYLTQQSAAVFQVDPEKQAEMQRLTEEWIQKQDMAILEQLQKLQEEMYAPAQAAGEVMEKGVGGIYPPGTGDIQEQARFFIAEERAGHVARLVVAYPLASLGRTVIQHAWSLADYPSAWPDTAPEQ